MNVFKTLGISLLPCFALVVSAKMGVINLSGEPPSVLQLDSTQIAQIVKNELASYEARQQSKAEPVMKGFSLRDNNIALLAQQLPALQEGYSKLNSKVEDLEGVIVDLGNVSQLNGSVYPENYAADSSAFQIQEQTLTLQESYEEDGFSEQGFYNPSIGDLISSSNFNISNQDVSCTSSACKVSFNRPKHTGSEDAEALVQSMRDSGISIPSYEVYYDKDGGVEIFLKQS